MYSSPGHADRHRLRRSASSTYTRVFAIGRPIGRRRSPRLDPVHRRPDRRLGRAVDVPHRSRRPRAGRRPARPAAPRRRTAPCSPSPAPPAGVQQHPPGGGRRLHHRRPRAAQTVQQRASIASVLAAGEHDPAADRERQEQLQRGDVERQARHRQQHVGLGHARRARHGLEQVQQRPVRDHHALRPAGRARGVDDVGEVLSPSSSPADRRPGPLPRRPGSSADRAAGIRAARQLAVR